MSNKRSKSIQLLAMGTVPFALVACSDDGTEVKTVKKDERFVNIQDCMKAGKPDYVCADSYLAAIKRHKEIAPKYENEADCESEFMKDYCVKSDDDKFMPKMAGFSLVTEQKQLVSSATGQPVVNQPSSSGHSGTDSNGFLTGLLVGNMMSSNNGPHYYSEPVYRRRDDRGDGYSTNTMSGYASSGIRPSKSIQAKVNSYSNSQTSKDYNSTRTNSGSNWGNSNSASTSSGWGSSGSNTSARSTYTKPSISVSDSTTRGGFGSVASARGGWGGG